MTTIGIDSVEIERFKRWTSFSKKKLLRIFSEDEIAYALSEPSKSSERLAVRFAAKEAFYKAIVTLLPQHVPFLSIGPCCSITFGKRGNPTLYVDWTRLSLQAYYKAHVSLTHTTTTATAVVVIDS